MERTSESKHRIVAPQAQEPVTTMVKVKPKTKVKPLATERVPASAPSHLKAQAESASSESSEEVHEWINRRASAQATRAANARQVSGRRRFVDPTTCERDYSNSEMEFMQAMHDYKHSSGRMFPTWSEVLEVLRSLGYEKPSDDAVLSKGNQKTVTNHA